MSASIPTDREIRDQAAAWLARDTATGGPGPDPAGLEAWLHQDPRNAPALASLRTAWDELAGFAASPAVAAARARIPGIAANQNLQAGTLGRRLAIAACAAGIAVIAVLVSSAPDPYRTGVGEQRTVSLPDGSEVVLDTDTSLKLSFTNDTRRVELAHGQALFHVAKDPTRPFTVVAGDGSVTALGTQFVVRREPAEMIVTLLEGSVEIVQQSRISAPATAPEAGSGLALPPVLHTAVQQIVLRPGQQVRSGAAGVSAPALPQLSEATAWKSGKLIFNDQPLGEAVDEVNRYARRKLRLGDPSLRAIRVSGVFDAGRTESFADALAGSMGLRAVSGEDGETVLLPRQK